MSRIRRTRIALAAGLVALVTAGFATPASACGGLVGENGSIRLVRTTTLAAWHDGVEHYVTSFEFSGSGKSVGSIIPLPAVPTNVEAAGQWTLQRLQREIAPPVRFALSGAGAAATSAEVLFTTQVEALDITVLKGGGDEVGKWALDNGFFLTPDAPEVLDFYAERSPIFLAAKFDAARAAAQGLNGGDGTPIEITMPTDRPWVPLRILGLGLPQDQLVQADLFLLTDNQPKLLTGTGLTLDRSEQASAQLMSDLRSDPAMEWMPQNLWLTHLALDEAAGKLRYDLSASAAGLSPSPLAAGYPFAVRSVQLPSDGWGVESYVALLGAVMAMAAGIAATVVHRAAARAGMKRTVGAVIAVLVIIGTPIVLLLSRSSAASGSGVTTVDLGVRYSHFSTSEITVQKGTTVRFVVNNDDPILHELIVGPPDVQDRHEKGTEAAHPPRPGEVTIQPKSTATTEYTFNDVGSIEFACHLPGHHAYGMTGQVRVTP